MRIVNYGLTPTAIDIIKDFERSEYPYMIVFAANSEQIPLYRYISDEQIYFEALEGMIHNEEEIEVYLSLADSITFYVNAIDKWDIADLMNDDLPFSLN